MISVSKHITSAAGVLSYHEEHYSAGDYYEREGKIAGQWFGKGAAALGLAGDVDRDDFEKLANNQNPKNGGQLTERQKENRRVAQDFTFAPPKSVSIAALVDNDFRVVAAHRAAVAAAAVELEKFAAVRLRKKNEKPSWETSGNIVAASFEHDTSRAAAAGLRPDPQLHTHLVVFNATQDSEGGWKALENVDILRAQKLLNAVYEHELAKGLLSAGYEIRGRGKSFEIANISDKEIDTFSKRHEAIQEMVAELKKNGATRNEKDLAEAVAHDGRIRKNVDDSAANLREFWQAELAEIRSNLSEEDFNSNDKIERKLTASEAVEFAKNHTFERSAVSSLNNFLADSLLAARGSDFSLKDVKTATRENSEIVAGDDGKKLTTQKVLENEGRCVALVESGKEKFSPLALQLVGERAALLNDLQRQAALCLIESQDFVTVFRGGAGTGKSFTLQVVQESVEKNGGSVVVVAPQNKQVLDLQKDFAEAATTQNWLGSVEKSPPAAGTVLLVDESGQISGEDMRKILETAQKYEMRVVLSGDTRQHGAVAASNALDAIEKFGSARTAELVGEDAIQRQSVALYKSAVADAEAGRVDYALGKLEKLGGIKEIKPPTPQELAELQRQATEKGEELKIETPLSVAAAAAAAGFEKNENLLVVSQTCVSVKNLNEEIRQKLVEKNIVSGSTIIDCVQGVDATKAQMLRKESYAGGAFLLAHQKGDEWQNGEKMQFLRETGNRGIVAINEKGQEIKISARNLAKFTVAKDGKMAVGEGERLQAKGNLRQDGKLLLANGEICTVEKLNSDGSISAKKANGSAVVLPADFKKISYGYAVTSYASQGATVDKILIADAGAHGASNQKEFYVSISRGRKECQIFTADKEDLLKRSSAKASAGLGLEIVPSNGQSFSDRFPSAKPPVEKIDAVKSPKIEATASGKVATPKTKNRGVAGKFEKVGLQKSANKQLAKSLKARKSQNQVEIELSKVAKTKTTPTEWTKETIQKVVAKCKKILVPRRIREIAARAARENNMERTTTNEIKL
jgi:conjugative relaxase-like TrwC/TraI family protein